MNKKKCDNMLKTIEKCAAIFLIIVVLGFILMCLTYSLPADNVHDNIMKDTEIFSEAYPRVIPNDPTTILDLYTDSIIISELLDKNEFPSFVKNAMAVYGSSHSDFESFVDGNMSVTKQYPRYWHGDLVLYNALFNFFDYTGIKMIQLFFELILIIGILKLMIENNLKNYIIPFVLSLFFIHPVVIGLCLQYAPAFFIMLISIYVLLKFKDKLFENNNLIYYFLIIGMSTSFFDFLTFPLICLGGPLIFYLLLENNEQTLKENIIKMILFAAIWSAGYIGMWFSKWIISSMLLNQNVISNGLGMFIARSSTEGVSRFDGLINNILIYNNNYYILIIGLISIYYIYRLFKMKNNITSNKLKKIIPFLLISITPFLWYLFASNHSYIHYWMTHRILFVFFFAIMCSLEYLIIKKEVRYENT